MSKAEHGDGSDALSHGGSEHSADFLGDMSQVHHTQILLPQFGPLPIYGSPTPTKDSEPARKRKSVDVSADWGQDDEDSSPEDAFSNTRPRVSWTVNNFETWHRIFDAQMNEIEQPGFRVEVDKGLKHSTEGEGWICQKKNHFQVCRSDEMSL